MIVERVYQGGLMRCCLGTLDEYLQSRDEPSQEGDTLDCKYEKDPENKNMIFQDGAWRWNRPPL